MPTETDSTTPTTPCATCGGTGIKRGSMRITLLSGRGSNFYRHGAYSTGGVRLGPSADLPTENPCPECEAGAPLPGESREEQIRRLGCRKNYKIGVGTKDGGEG